MARRYRVLAARATRLRQRAGQRHQAAAVADAPSASRSLGVAGGERGLGVSAGDVEVALLDAAADLHGRRPSLSDRVGEVFSTASMVRKLLGRCQDLIEERFGCRVGLASGSDAEASGLTGYEYAELAGWIVDKVEGV